MVSLPDVETLLAPIASDAAAGHFDEEDALYQSVDQEMLKQGGLHAARLDWARVEADAAEYLRLHCKHFRVVSHLCAAWWRRQEWQAWLRSLQLIAGMLDLYWLNGWPQTGSDGLTAKRKTLLHLGIACCM